MNIMKKLEGNRKADIIKFDNDGTASLIREDGKRVNEDVFFEQSDIINEIKKGFKKDKLDNAFKLSSSENISYCFEFKDYYPRKEKQIKSVVKIVVPKKDFDINNPYIKYMENKTTQIKNVKIFKKAFAVLAIATAINMGGNFVNNFVEHDNAKYEQEVERIKQEVEDLTGKTTEEITNSGKTSEIESQDKVSSFDENYFDKINLEQEEQNGKDQEIFPEVEEESRQY